jgi:ribonucleoside-diphosphate reductase alpha chain
VAAPGPESPSTPPAREWPNDSPRSTASPASGSGNGAAPAKSNGNGNGSRVTLGTLGIGKAQVTFAAQADAPSCAECGSIMVRNGSCYKCLNCGSTSGCS